MPEPLSIVPLLRAKARFLIAAGDPKQLPPVIASPAEVAPAATAAAPSRAADGPAPAGLLRPLFVRLAGLGCARAFLLRRQYRCAPAISLIPNQQFYGGRLLDGVSAEARASLLPGLPSLALLDVRGVGQRGQYGGRAGGGRGGAANAAEAACVVGLVRRLLAAGVRPGAIGVICLFRHEAGLPSDWDSPARRLWDWIAATPARAPPPPHVPPHNPWPPAPHPPSTHTRRAQVALVQQSLERALPQLQQAAAASAAQCTRLESEAQGSGGGGGGAVPAAALPDVSPPRATSGDGSAGGHEGVGGGGSAGRRGHGGAAAAPGGVRVATVDSFQGAESEAIILTTAATRASAFAADPRRLNVALTRARRNLLVVGCAPALQASAPAWAALVRRCRATPGGYWPGGRLELSGRPDQARLPPKQQQQQELQDGWAEVHKEQEAATALFEAEAAVRAAARAHT